MRKNKVLLIVLGVLLSMALSCKTTPDKTDETPPKEDVKPELDLKTLDDAAGRAETARKRAMDFEASKYFPSEWGNTEAQYTEAGSISRNTQDNVNRAANLFSEAADAYNGFFEKAVPLYAQAREDEIIAIRDELVATGLAYYFPEYLEGADEVALEALEQYENKDYYAAKDTAARSLEIFGTLASGASAYLARQEILTRDFVMYDSDNFDKAEEAGSNAVDAYDEGKIKAARDGADEALLRYNLVLNTAWAHFASVKGEAAEAERQKAIDAKANVAVRDLFNAANDAYEKAAASLKEEKFAEAGNLFEKADAQFIESVRLAEAKRVVAENAIREAEERAEASEEAARRAEEIIEGGSL
jgi:hypothetical protein